jgi:gametolysin peptidase M11/alpha-galactosidase-like protein
MSSCRSVRNFSVLSAFLLTVLTLARSTEIVAQAPSDFQKGWQSGTPVAVTGVVSAIYADDFANQRSELVHMMRDERTGQSFQLHFEKQTPQDLRSGAKIKVVGRSLGSEIYVAGCCESTMASTTSSSLQTTNVSTAPLTGDQPTLVMVTNFLDKTVSCSVDAMNNAMFADATGLSVDALYRDSSRGRISFSGSVVGPFRINVLSTDSCDLNGWALAADAQATAAGVDVASYRHKVYVMPASMCPAAGYGSVGGAPSHAWDFACDTRGVLTHEIGHNIGMDHAGTYYPGNGFSEYGDWTDPMGMSTWQMRGLNAPHRHQLGWVDAASTQWVNQDGFYNVAPLAIDPATAAAPQVLTIRKPDIGEYYYLSYRTNQGFDQQISGWYQGRLSVHRYKGDGSSSFTYLLGGLADGESFVDETNGITVTLVSHNTSYATARIQFACVPNVPSMTASPAVQNGAPGQSVSYTVAVTNYDVQSCPATTFSLNDVIPAGWTSTILNPTITVGPGETGQATVSVTSSGGAQAGTYSATVNASDTVAAEHATSAVLTYTVPDTVSPTPPPALTATANNKSKQIQLSWGVASDNVGVVGYRVSRNGATVGSSTTTSWIDRTWSAGASYTYSVAAYDAVGNVSMPSNTVTITLSGGGKRK